MLTQRQLFLVSRLFVGASKAKLGFDLSRFSKEHDYAMEVLVRLSEQATDQELQGRVAEVMVEMMSVSPPPVDGVFTSSPNAKFGGSEQAPAAPSAEKKYVGSLR
jgi:hypothetical protein